MTVAARAEERDWAESDFIRIYQKVRDDPKFATIYPDDRAWAAYVRLLMDAEAAWPIHPSLPRHLTKYARGKLVGAGILAIAGQTYSISGLDKERESRRGRWGKDGTGRPRYPSDSKAAADSEIAPEVLRDRSDFGVPAGASRSASPSPSNSSSSSTAGLADAREDDAPDMAVLSWMASVHASVRPDGNGYHREVVRLASNYTADRVIDAMKARLAAGERSPRQLIYGAANDLEPIGGRSGKGADRPKGHTRPLSEVSDAFER